MSNKVEVLETKVEALEVEVGRCPIKFSVIQLYAEEYERSNQNHIETVVEFKKIITEQQIMKTDLKEIKESMNLILDWIRKVNRS